MLRSNDERESSSREVIVPKHSLMMCCTWLMMLVGHGPVERRLVNSDLKTENLGNIVPTAMITHKDILQDRKRTWLKYNMST